MKVARIHSYKGKPLAAKGSEAWRVSGVDKAVINIMRRALMADVPVQAVDMVTFYKWDCAIESEMVAHRLGQLPVQGLEPMTFEIQVTAPPNKPLTWVKPSHITGPDAHRICKGDEFGEFLIAPLLAGQRLHVVCRTSLGTGRKDARWNSTFPILYHDEDEEEEEEVDGDEDIDGSQMGIKSVMSEPNGCTFIVETTGALSPTQAWFCALDSSIQVMDAIVLRLRS
jgi:DNA-directed RNA polymerase subunit D